MAVTFVHEDLLIRAPAAGLTIRKPLLDGARNSPQTNTQPGVQDGVPGRLISKNRTSPPASGAA
jgi:hypothetical protein